MHDRACELYQQIVGIAKITEQARKNQVDVAEQVYGGDQVRDKHRCRYYKPRYLRKTSGDLTKTTAHPNGIKNWSAANKVHLVGHSLGAQTIRYLQHLLRIGFFDDEHKGEDRSDWIASISCVSAPMNGTHVTHNFGFDEASSKFKKGSWMIKLFKYKVITANLLSKGCTQNQLNEKVIRQTVSLDFITCLGRLLGAGPDLLKRNV